MPGWVKSGKEGRKCEREQTGKIKRLNLESADMEAERVPGEGTFQATEPGIMERRKLGG